MRFNTTVANISPLLHFLPAASWNEQPIASNLQLQTNTTTYHTSNSSLVEPGVTFSWDGTAIWIYGDRYPISSPFKVTLDGKEYRPTASPDGVLFSIANLKPDIHHIALSNIGDGHGNQPPPMLNFNYLVFEQEYDDAATNVVVQGSDEQFQYYSPPHGTWNNQSINARVFQGFAISVYGSVGGTQGGYSVSIDGNPWQRYTPNTQGNGTSQLLYYWSGPDTNHSLILQNDPSGGFTEDCSDSKSWLAVDHASVYLAPGASATRPPTSVSPTKRKVVIIAVCAATLAVFLIGWIVRRWYLKRNRYLANTRQTQAPHPFPKEEPYNPPGAPATEIVNIAVISRLSEDGQHKINNFDDVVLDISAANNVPDDPFHDSNQIIHSLREKPSVGSAMTSTSSSSISSGGILSAPPQIYMGSTMTPAISSTSITSTGRPARPLPSRPIQPPTAADHRTVFIEPPPYYNNISL